MMFIHNRLFVHGSGWVRNYVAENHSSAHNDEITDEGRKSLAIRRRIEDIKEAARLERDALYETWEL